MNSNLVVPVPRKAVQEAIATLNRYIILANKVTGGSSLEELKEAEAYLHTAEGIFWALDSFKMVGNSYRVSMDLARIEEKIKGLMYGVVK